MLKKITIKNILSWAILKLKNKNILSAQLDAEILLAHLLKKSKEFLYTYPEYKITKSQELEIKNYAKRRVEGEPLAYILRYKEFYGLKFKVNKNVLVPRPETEMMVELVTCNLKHKTQKNSKKIIVDVGTGSGCIIISIVKNLNQGIPLCHSRKNGNPKNYTEPTLKSGFRISARGGSAFGGKYGMTNIEFYAIDNSKKALAVAQKNAQFHGVGKQIKFLKGDLLKPLIKKLSVVSSQLSVVIVANLPYLTPRQYQQNHELRFEPRSALVGGDDGLKYIKLFLQQLAKLVPQVKTITAYLEIDPYQAKKVKKLVNLYLPKSSFQIKKDLSGQNRLAIIKC